MQPSMSQLLRNSTTPLPPNTAAVFFSSSLLPHPSTTPLTPDINIFIATMGRAMPCRQLTGCIRRAKKGKMSVFRRYMGLSHLAVGFRHYLQRGIALVGSASHSAAQTISQMVVIHAAFHGAGQVVPAATMRTLICIQLAHCVQSCSTFTRLFCLDHELHDVPLDEENDHPSIREEESSSSCISTNLPRPAVNASQRS